MRHALTSYESLTRHLALVLIACSAGCAARPAAPPPAPPPPASAPARPSAEVSATSSGRTRPEGALLGYAPPRAREPQSPTPAPAAGPAPQALAGFEPDAPPPDDWRKPVGLVGVAVGTTMVALGVSASISISKLKGEFQENHDFLQYRAGVQRGGDICDAADRGAVSPLPDAANRTLIRERCRTLSMWRLVQPVGYAGGGLLILGGAGLLISAALAPPHDDSTRTGRLRLRFAPSLGPSLAGATLAGAW
jgi:hypothetical protein